MTPQDPDANERIVIIGGGHAAAALCGALRAAGRGQDVDLVCAEEHLPYHRPPLSKNFLKASEETTPFHRKHDWFADSGITVHGGVSAKSIDRAARTVTLSSGVVLPYGQLVLATGSRARSLASLPDGLRNVFTLRSLSDAMLLRDTLAASGALTVLGGGFIGLEVAATARALGKQVTVLESAPRLLARALSPELSAFVLEAHRAAGVDIRVGVTIADFEIEDDRLEAVTVDGVREPVEVLLAAIGGAPEQALAEEAGLACGNGVWVDPRMRTSDDRVLAIGDCASVLFDGGGDRLRLESVQNATDQARAALATLTGRAASPRAVPSFWSDQGAMRIQIAGLMPPQPASHRRDGPEATSFSLFHYDADRRLACVESVNSPREHLAARKLLEAGVSPDPAAACDPKVPLASLA